MTTMAVTVWTGTEDRVVRGGSWRDRPVRARSAFRLGYRPYQAVYNVGFRVVCDAASGAADLAINRDCSGD